MSNSSSWHTTIDDVKLAFVKYLYSSTIASSILIAYISWNLMRELWPWFRCGVIFGWVNMILNAAASVHVVILYFTSDGHYDWAYWFFLFTGGFSSIVALYFSLVYLCRGVVRYFKFRDFMLALSPNVIITVGRHRIRTNELCPSFTVVESSSNVAGKVTSKVYVGGAPFIIDGSVRDSTVVGFEGTECFKYHHATEVRVEEYSGVLFHIFVLNPSEFAFDRRSAYLPVSIRDIKGQ